MIFVFSPPHLRMCICALEEKRNVADTPALPRKTLLTGISAPDNEPRTRPRRGSGLSLPASLPISLPMSPPSSDRKGLLLRHEVLPTLDPGFGVATIYTCHSCFTGGVSPDMVRASLHGISYPHRSGLFLEGNRKCKHNGTCDIFVGWQSGHFHCFWPHQFSYSKDRLGKTISRI